MSHSAELPYGRLREALATAQTDLRKPLTPSEAGGKLSLTDSFKSARILYGGVLLHVVAPDFAALAQSIRPHSDRTYTETDVVTPEFVKDAQRVVYSVQQALNASIYQLYKHTHYESNPKAREVYDVLSEMLDTSQREGYMTTSSVTDALEAGAGSFRQVTAPLVNTLATNEDGTPVTVGEFIRNMTQTNIPRHFARELIPQMVDEAVVAARRNAAGEIQPGFSYDHLEPTRRGPDLPEGRLRELPSSTRGKIGDVSSRLEQSIFGCVMLVPESSAKQLGVIEQSRGYGTFYNLLYTTLGETLQRTLIRPGNTTPPQR